MDILAAQIPPKTNGAPPPAALTGQPSGTPAGAGFTTLLNGLLMMTGAAAPQGQAPTTDGKPAKALPASTTLPQTVAGLNGAVVTTEVDPAGVPLIEGELVVPDTAAAPMVGDALPTGEVVPDAAPIEGTVPPAMVGAAGPDQGRVPMPPTGILPLVTPKADIRLQAAIAADGNGVAVLRAGLNTGTALTPADTSAAAVVSASAGELAAEVALAAMPADASTSEIVLPASPVEAPAPDQKNANVELVPIPAAAVEIAPVPADATQLAAVPTPVGDALPAGTSAAGPLAAENPQPGAMPSDTPIPTNGSAPTGAADPMPTATPTAPPAAAGAAPAGTPDPAPQGQAAAPATPAAPAAPTAPADPAQSTDPAAAKPVTAAPASAPAPVPVDEAGQQVPAAATTATVPAEGGSTEDGAAAPAKSAPATPREIALAEAGVKAAAKDRTGMPAEAAATPSSPAAQVESLRDWRGRSREARATKAEPAEQQQTPVAAAPAPAPQRPAAPAPIEALSPAGNGSAVSQIAGAGTPSQTGGQTGSGAERRDTYQAEADLQARALSASDASKPALSEFAQLVATARPGRPGHPPAAPQQVALHIQRAVADGQDRMTLQLRPADLGRIDVQLNFGKDGVLSAKVMADNAGTLDMLQRDARGLERALQDAGLKTDANGLSFSLRDPGGQAQRESGGQQGGRSMTLKIGEQEAAATTAATPALALGPGRVDVRV